MLAFVPDNKSNLEKESLNFELPSKEDGNEFEFDLVIIKPDQLNRKVLRCSVLFYSSSSWELECQDSLSS